jgi:hypothetical protein
VALTSACLLTAALTVSSVWAGCAKPVLALGTIYWGCRVKAQALQFKKKCRESYSQQCRNRLKKSAKKDITKWRQES